MPKPLSPSDHDQVQSVLETVRDLMTNCEGSPFEVLRALQKGIEEIPGAQVSIVSRYLGDDKGSFDDDYMAELDPFDQIEQGQLQAALVVAAHSMGNSAGLGFDRMVERALDAALDKEIEGMDLSDPDEDCTFSPA